MIDVIRVEVPKIGQQKLTKSTYSILSQNDEYLVLDSPKFDVIRKYEEVISAHFVLNKVEIWDTSKCSWSGGGISLVLYSDKDLSETTHMVNEAIENFIKDETQTIRGLSKVSL